MRWSSLILALALTALCAAAPAPAPAADPSDDSKPEIIEIIAPANPGAQETLASLDLGAPGSELGDRNKRTIGILRQLFPQLTQILEQKVQQLTSVVLQTFGPVVLRAFLGNRGGEGGNTGGGGGTVELSDDDSDEEETSDVTTEAGERRRRALPNVAADENQLLSGAESQQAEVRVAFGEGGAAAAEGAAGADAGAAGAGEDQQAAAQTNNASIDEISLDDADASGEDRNKRFLSFGGSGGAGGGGGSGNFLFDIVRRPAAAMVRAAGGAWRLLQGADSLSLGLTASHTGSDTQLVAGSSSGSSGGDAGAESEGDEASAGKGDNLTEGVPGPITRLFIIANRGIANLVQDLILRLAQTSERIVNFKARLITSII